MDHTLRSNFMDAPDFIGSDGALSLADQYTMARRKGVVLPPSDVSDVTFQPRKPRPNGASPDALVEALASSGIDPKNIRKNGLPSSVAVLSESHASDPGRRSQLRPSVPSSYNRLSTTIRPETSTHSFASTLRRSQSPGLSMSALGGDPSTNISMMNSAVDESMASSSNGLVAASSNNRRSKLDSFRNSTVLDPSDLSFSQSGTRSNVRPSANLLTSRMENPITRIFASTVRASDTNVADSIRNSRVRFHQNVDRNDNVSSVEDSNVFLRSRSHSPSASAISTVSTNEMPFSSPNPIELAMKSFSILSASSAVASVAPVRSSSLEHETSLQNVSIPPSSKIGAPATERREEVHAFMRLQRRQRAEKVALARTASMERSERRNQQLRELELRQTAARIAAASSASVGRPMGASPPKPARQEALAASVARKAELRSTARILRDDKLGVGATATRLGARLMAQNILNASAVSSISPDPGNSIEKRDFSEENHNFENEVPKENTFRKPAVPVQPGRVSTITPTSISPSPMNSIKSDTLGEKSTKRSYGVRSPVSPVPRVRSSNSPSKTKVQEAPSASPLSLRARARAQADRELAADDALQLAQARWAASSSPSNSSPAVSRLLTPQKRGSPLRAAALARSPLAQSLTNGKKQQKQQADFRTSVKPGVNLAEAPDASLSESFVLSPESAEQSPVSHMPSVLSQVVYHEADSPSYAKDQGNQLNGSGASSGFHGNVSFPSGIATNLYQRIYYENHNDDFISSKENSSKFTSSREGLPVVGAVENCISEVDASDTSEYTTDFPFSPSPTTPAEVQSPVFTQNPVRNSFSGENASKSDITESERILLNDMRKHMIQMQLELEELRRIARTGGISVSGSDSHSPTSISTAENIESMRIGPRSASPTPSEIADRVRSVTVPGDDISDISLEFGNRSSENSSGEFGVFDAVTRAEAYLDRLKALADSLPSKDDVVARSSIRNIRTTDFLANSVSLDGSDSEISNIYAPVAVSDSFEQERAALNELLQLQRELLETELKEVDSKKDLSSELEADVEHMRELRARRLQLEQQHGILRKDSSANVEGKRASFQLYQQEVTDRANKALYASVQALRAVESPSAQHDANENTLALRPPSAIEPNLTVPELHALEDSGVSATRAFRDTSIGRAVAERQPIQVSLPPGLLDSAVSKLMKKLAGVVESPSSPSHSVAPATTEAVPSPEEKGDAEEEKVDEVEVKSTLIPQLLLQESRELLSHPTLNDYVDEAIAKSRESDSVEAIKFPSAGDIAMGSIAPSAEMVDAHVTSIVRPSATASLSVLDEEEKVVSAPAEPSDPLEDASIMTQPKLSTFRGAPEIMPARASPDELFMTLLSHLDALQASEEALVALATLNAEQADLNRQREGLAITAYYQSQADAAGLAAQLAAVEAAANSAAATGAAEAARLAQMEADRFSAAHQMAAHTLVSEVARYSKSTSSLSSTAQKTLATTDTKEHLVQPTPVSLMAGQPPRSFTVTPPLPSESEAKSKESPRKETTSPNSEEPVPENLEYASEFEAEEVEEDVLASDNAFIDGAFSSPATQPFKASSNTPLVERIAAGKAVREQLDTIESDVAVETRVGRHGSDELASFSPGSGMSSEDFSDFLNINPSDPLYGALLQQLEAERAVLHRKRILARKSAREQLESLHAQKEALKAERARANAADAEFHLDGGLTRHELQHFEEAQSRVILKFRRKLAKIESQLAERFGAFYEEVLHSQRTSVARSLFSTPAKGASQLTPFTTPVHATSYTPFSSTLSSSSSSMDTPRRRGQGSVSRATVLALEIAKHLMGSGFLGRTSGSSVPSQIDQLASELESLEKESIRAVPIPGISPLSSTAPTVSTVPNANVTGSTNAIAATAGTSNGSPLGAAALNLRSISSPMSSSSSSSAPPSPRASLAAELELSIAKGAHVANTAAVLAAHPELLNAHPPSLPAAAATITTSGGSSTRMGGNETEEAEIEEDIEYQDDFTSDLEDSAASGSRQVSTVAAIPTNVSSNTLAKKVDNVHSLSTIAGIDESATSATGLQLASFSISRDTTLDGPIAVGPAVSIHPTNLSTVQSELVEAEVEAEPDTEGEDLYEFTPAVHTTAVASSSSLSTVSAPVASSVSPAVVPPSFTVPAQTAAEIWAEEVVSFGTALVRQLTPEELLFGPLDQLMSVTLFIETEAISSPREKRRISQKLGMSNEGLQIRKKLIFDLVVELLPSVRAGVASAAAVARRLPEGPLRAEALRELHSRAAAKLRSLLLGLPVNLESTFAQMIVPVDETEAGMINAEVPTSEAAESDRALVTTAASLMTVDGTSLAVREAAETSRLVRQMLAEDLDDIFGSSPSSTAQTTSSFNSPGIPAVNSHINVIDELPHRMQKAKKPSLIPSTSLAPSSDPGNGVPSTLEILASSKSAADTIAAINSSRLSNQSSNSTLNGSSSTIKTFGSDHATAVSEIMLGARDAILETVLDDVVSNMVNFTVDETVEEM